jgi:branched-subunit amino acid aminotransferase/4-amino-4-deoxychorismate lyase
MIRGFLELFMFVYTKVVSLLSWCSWWGSGWIEHELSVFIVLHTDGCFLVGSLAGLSTS